MPDDPLVEQQHEALQASSEEEKNQPEEVEKHISSNVCDTCLNDNLLKAVGITNCSRCKQPYCLHYASKIDPQYCVDCMSDLSVTKSIVTKEYTHEDDEGNVISKYSRRARQIVVSGFDWLFAQRKIKTLTDAELDMAIEYHRTICNWMIVESEQRRNEKMHRYANTKVVLPTVGTTTATSVTTKKTTTTSSTRQKAQLSSIMSTLAAKGFTPTQLAELLKGMK